MAAVNGTSGDDDLTGTSGDDVFDLTQGGDDTASGANGNDLFLLGATLTEADRIDGGFGDDTVSLSGDYSAGLVFGADTFQSVETLRLGNGFDYNLTLVDDNVAARRTMTIDAGALTGAHALILDAFAETDGHLAIVGGAGDDHIVGGALSGSFTLSNGGSDTVQAGGGDDVFDLGRALDLNDRLDGGAGNDTLLLKGDYSAGLVFGADTIRSIETIRLGGAFSYDLTLNDATIAAGARLTINATPLAGSHGLTLDASAETDGNLLVYGSAGSDNLKGGALSDVFYLGQGGADTADGGGGDDVMRFDAAFTAADKVDGGAGDDRIILNGDYSAGLTFAADTMVNVERLQLSAGHDYKLTMNDANLAQGAYLIVNANALGAGNRLTFDGSAESDGHYVVTGSAGDDALTGGARADTFHLERGGNDTVHGGNGNDVFYFGGAYTAADSVDGGLGSDTLNLAGDYHTGLTLGAAALGGIETLAFGAGNFVIATNDANVAAGQTLTVDATGMGFSAFAFDGSAETDGNFLFHFGANLLAADTLVGGAGDDTLLLDGPFTLFHFGATTIDSIETVEVAAGHDYQLAFADGAFTAGDTLTVDGRALGAGNSLSVSPDQTGGSYVMYGGAGADQLVGGVGDNLITGGGGADTMNGSGGHDTFIYTQASDSTGASGHDSILAFDPGQEMFDFGFTVSGVASTSGRVDQNTFDNDVAILSHAQAFGATVIQVTSGGYIAHYLLVVDATGDGNYTAGQDYVIDLGFFTVSPITIADFVTH
ncbi:MAG TPA: calcium-binding protein [Rhizomicrobium sp.]|nr:calcium-binding protein [Rhizomicrobium sp.]